jgi:Glycosyl transferase family 11
LLRLVPGGRLGNQLFQYAAVRAQAKRLGVGMEIELTFWDKNPPSESFTFWLDTLPIHARIIRYPAFGPLSSNSVVQRAYRRFVRPAFWKQYAEPLWQKDNRFFAIQSWTIVSGLFQSLFYLLPRDEEILSELSLWHAASSDAAEFAKLIGRQTSISVHVRRGDAIWRKDETGTLPVWQCHHVAYFEAAIDLMRKKVSHPIFLIFSDDIKWCKQSGLFKKDCEFIEPDQFGNNPAIDLLFMSSCKHHIITNSTYSWWAAWAALEDEKICILPNKWTSKHTTRELGLVYENWIAL